MPRAAWFLALSAANLANAATVGVEFYGPGVKSLTLPVEVDDAHLCEPPGYFAPSLPAARVVRRIVVENTGGEPISRPDIRINGRPLFPAPDAAANLGVDDPRDLPSLFAAWRDRIVHATTDLEAARDPLELLGDLGAAYCGDDARALATITVSGGGVARFARLNGHSAAEHRSGSSWVLLDGDQNLLYLGWDNRTPVGEAEILADPLLALRTQVFGRQSTWELAAAWQNAARFEFVDASREQKTFRLKGATSSRDWQLFPGEKIVFLLDSEPPEALAATKELRSSQALRNTVCTVEFHSGRDASTPVRLPFPIMTRDAGEPAYEAASANGTITGQVARAQIPPLLGGANSIEARNGGRLSVMFDYEPSEKSPVPAPVVHPRDGVLHVEGAAPDRMWWQISRDADFHLVAPNLDRVTEPAATIKLSKIDESFLDNGDWFARVRVRRDGVWSDWSPVASFSVGKPEAPHPLTLDMEGADGDQMHIRWKPADGEMLVFGSNRLDFLPEIYGDSEVVRMENGAIRERRPNRNLLATIPAREGEAWVPLRACYRLVLRRDAVLSVPSPLLRAKNMPAVVLQNRHEKKEGALTGTDVAAEMEVPRP